MASAHFQRQNGVILWWGEAPVIRTNVCRGAFDAISLSHEAPYLPSRCGLALTTNYGKPHFPSVFCGDGASGVGGSARQPALSALGLKHRSLWR
jgi:hypothetical protein